MICTYLEGEQIGDDDIGNRLEAGCVGEYAETHGEDRQPARQPHAGVGEVEPRRQQQHAHPHRERRAHEEQLGKYNGGALLRTASKKNNRTSSHIAFCDTLKR